MRLYRRMGFLAPGDRTRRDWRLSPAARVARLHHPVRDAQASSLLGGTRLVRSRAVHARAKRGPPEVGYLPFGAGPRQCMRESVRDDGSPSRAGHARAPLSAHAGPPAPRRAVATNSAAIATWHQDPDRSTHLISVPRLSEIPAAALRHGASPEGSGEFAPARLATLKVIILVERQRRSTSRAARGPSVFSLGGRYEAPDRIDRRPAAVVGIADRSSPGAEQEWRLGGPCPSDRAKSGGTQETLGRHARRPGDIQRVWSCSNCRACLSLSRRASRLALRTDPA